MDTTNNNIDVPENMVQVGWGGPPSYNARYYFVDENVDINNPNLPPTMGDKLHSDETLVWFNDIGEWVIVNPHDWHLRMNGEDKLVNPWPVYAFAHDLPESKS